jgi:peptidyl-dipeptidase A
VRTSKLIPLVLLAACGGPKKSPEPVSAPAPTAGAEQAATVPAPQEPHQDAALVAEAKQFVVDADKELRQLWVEASKAEWANQTDITPEHEAAAAKANEAAANGITRLIKASRKFDAVQDQLDPDTRRQLLLLKFAGQPAPDDPAQATELAKIAAETYTRGTSVQASQ